MLSSPARRRKRGRRLLQSAQRTVTASTAGCCVSATRRALELSDGFRQGVERPVDLSGLVCRCFVIERLLAGLPQQRPDIGRAFEPLDSEHESALTSAPVRAAAALRRCPAP